MPPVIKPTRSDWGSTVRFALVLGAILTVLFIKSFLPGYVHCSNDGPLAVQMSQCFQLPEAFIGAWDDLNWLGFNSSLMPLEFTSLIKLVLGPVGYAKFLAPIAIFIFGMCAWAFLRRLKLSPTACWLGALAGALNITFLGTACWGVASQVIGFGMDYLALALVVSNTKATPVWLRWLRLVLAGFAVGIGVMEGADNGAIFSMFVAAFVMVYSLLEEGSVGINFLKGVGRVAVIAVCAGLIAMQSIVGLIGTQISGISGMEPKNALKHWDWATQWSTPKVETLGWVIPGLFGYRMDTPNDMPKWLQESYRGGNYWGKGGRDPAWDRYFAGTGPKPDAAGQYIRSSGGGNYMGVLVALVMLWTLWQSFRKRDPVFSLTQRRLIWFWSAAMLVCLLLAFGRFAPFYRILYMLPYFSTIRNPCKFTAVFGWASIVVFSYGIDALCRRYLYVAASGNLSPLDTLRVWWRKKAGGADRRWIIGCMVTIGLSFVGWLIYANCKDRLVEYLKTVLFDQNYANQIATFSIHSVGWFILFLILGVAAMALIFSGAFAGKRARWGGIILGLILVADLGRASLPYIVHWNYEEKYASDAVIDHLRVKPYEQRVLLLPFPTPPEMELFCGSAGMYNIEWVQQLFPYYDILSIDLVQMPRAPAVFVTFESALRARDNTELYRLARRWELTSTRYLLGGVTTRLPIPDDTGKVTERDFRTLDFLNNGLDVGKARFRVVTQFEIAAKPGVERPMQYEQLSAYERPDGKYALYEFTGALPRAKLYDDWQVNTNDEQTLITLASERFVPQQTVIVSTPYAKLPSASLTNKSPGEVTITDYKSADIRIQAEATADSILLLNDRYDPEWKVYVDGQRAELLRCNYVMRGVALTPGRHTVEFCFRPSLKPEMVTLVMIILAVLLSGVMLYSERQGDGAGVPRGNGKGSRG